MSRTFENFYTHWRFQIHGPDFLRDEGGVPNEQLLQAVWQRQRLRRDALKTADGKIVRVFHPGFASAEGGPDFRGAVLQIGDDTPRTGDVEVDLRTAGWRAHGHDKNPSFKNVILHVVWDAEQSSGNGPVILPLKDSLDSTLAELSLSLEGGSLRTLPEYLRGKCCAPLCELDEARLGELLSVAARVRLETKAGQFRIRAKDAGWEQALWEGLFRALGYKHNVWPMQNLSETKLFWSRGTKSIFEIQARLFGISGLLPNELTRAQRASDGYLCRIWDCWWREREEFSEIILPRSTWKFHGLRPANHPHRRLALAAHWLTNGNFVSEIEKWPVTQIADKKLLQSLHKIFQVECDEFWSWHWTLKSPRLKRPQPLLGETRVTDLAINVILPWLWVRADEGKNQKFRREIERRFFAWPTAEDNSVLKLARQRLLGASSGKILKSGAAQQGLMQIVRDFCSHSNAICDDCRFPELVRDWKVQS